MVKHTPWMLTQTWEHLLFLHWEIDPSSLTALIPKELELDVFEGKAWVTILPFRVSRQRFRWLPEIPFLNSYLELNVRTYVKYKGYQGVYFFSLDANHPLAVLGAKAASLPYRLAKMDMHQQNNKIVFTSKRLFGCEKFSANYQPISAPAPTEPGSLDNWLLERYSLFTKWGPFILRGDILHEKWEVSNVKAKIEENSVFPMGDKPLRMHYSLKKQTLIFPLKKQ